MNDLKISLLWAVFFNTLKEVCEANKNLLAKRVRLKLKQRKGNSDIIMVFKPNYERRVAYG